VRSDLTLATLAVLLLNTIFRFGATRNATISIPIDADRYQAVARFLQMTGASWGARQEPIWRSVSAVTEFLELAPDLVSPGTPIGLSMSCDDQLLQIRISYAGLPMDPTAGDLDLNDLEAGDAGQRRFAAALMPRLCGDVKFLRHHDHFVCQLTFSQ
jgi:hypothetical protein